MQSRYSSHTQWDAYEPPSVTIDGRAVRLFLEFRMEPQIAPRIRFIAHKTGSVSLEQIYPSVVVTCIPRAMDTRRHVRFAQWVRRTLRDQSSGLRPTGTYALVDWPEPSGPNRREDRNGDCCRAFSRPGGDSELLTIRQGGELRLCHESIYMIGVCNLDAPDRWVAGIDWQAAWHLRWPAEGPAPQILSATCGFTRTIKVASETSPIGNVVHLTPSSEAVLRQLASETPASMFVNALM